jgi:hypothetical protein
MSIARHPLNGVPAIHPLCIHNNPPIFPSSLAQRDNKRSRVIVQVVGEAEVLQLEFDDVAEYLGDTHSDDW